MMNEKTATNLTDEMDKTDKTVKISLIGSICGKLFKMNEKTATDETDKTVKISLISFICGYV